MVKYTCKQEARVYLPSYVFAQISKKEAPGRFLAAK